MVAQVEVQLLGPVRVTRTGRAERLPGRRTVATLAVLALEAPRTVSRDRLVDLLWGEQPPRTAVNALQGSVSAIRRALGAATVLTSGRGYALSEHVVLDTEVFDQHLARAAALRDRSPGLAHRELIRALDLYSGTPLAGLEDFPFAQTAASRWEEQRVVALEQRLELDLQLGLHREAVAELDELLRRIPEREPLWALQVRALGLCGRQEEALAIYQRARAHLLEDLGVEPGPALRAAQTAVLNQDRPLAPPRPDKSGDGHVQRMVRRAPPPRLLDETRGRDADLEVVARTLTSPGRTRLVTITGPGGVGKTRLAAEVAQYLSPTFADGVTFVSLAEAQLPRDALPTICGALGLAAGADPGVSLRAALDGAELLLVCDNFEHVLDAAPQLATLVADLPGLRMLVTSRAPLDVPGERCHPLRPLTVRSADGPAPAIELFCDRLSAADPGLLSGCEDEKLLADICERCDGLPLALEFAAARAPLLGLVALRAELEKSASRLTGRVRGSPSRQRSLEANLAWSIDLLQPQPRMLLGSLFVFDGGFTSLAAAVVAGLEPAVCEEALDVLLRYSLLRRTSTSHGIPRYDVLQTTRDHLAAASGPAQQHRLRHRHAEHYRAMLTAAPVTMLPPQRPRDWWKVLPERANIRAAIRWALEAGQSRLAADLVIGSYALWDRVGPKPEHHAWRRLLLDSDEISTTQRIDILLCLDLDEDVPADIRQWSGEAQLLANRIGDSDRALAARTHDCIAAPLADDAAPLDLAALARELDHRADTGSGELGVVIGGLLVVGAAMAFDGAGPQGAAYTRRALDLAVAHQATFYAVGAFNNLAEIALLMGEPSAARDHATQGLQLLHQAFEGPAGMAFESTDQYNLLSQLGCALAHLGDLPAAVAALSQALDGHLRIDARAPAGEDTLRLAWALATDHPQAAASLFLAYETAHRSEPWMIYPYAARLTHELHARLPEAGSRPAVAEVTIAGPTPPALATLRAAAGNVAALLPPPSGAPAVPPGTSR